MIDTTTPTISINSNLPTSITKGDSYPILGSYVANGPSSGSASCSSNRDGAVEDTKQLTTIGSHIITCTVTTGAKKSASTTKTINITYTSYQITNLATNGSFENSDSNWYNYSLPDYSFYDSFDLTPYPTIPKKYGNSTVRISMNQRFFPRIRYSNVNSIKGHKVYAKVSFLVEVGNSTPTPGLFLIFSETNEDWPTTSQEKSTLGVYSSRKVWYDMSVYQDSSPYNYLIVSLGQTARDLGTMEIIHFDGLTVVDLTKTFGSGNEPDKDWCDKHINYFDGTTTIHK